MTWIQPAIWNSTWSVQDGPLLVVSGIKTPINGLMKWVTGVKIAPRPYNWWLGAHLVSMTFLLRGVGYVFAVHLCPSFQVAEADAAVRIRYHLPHTDVQSHPWIHGTFGMEPFWKLRKWRSFPTLLEGDSCSFYCFCSLNPNLFTTYLLLMAEILLTTWDVWNPINNGKNYQPQLVQDFSHQQ